MNLHEFKLSFVFQLFFQMGFLFHVSWQPKMGLTMAAAFVIGFHIGLRGVFEYEATSVIERFLFYVSCGPTGR